MKISRIAIYRKNLSDGSEVFAWGRGNVIESSSSTIVVVDTDASLSGVGEFCGENHMVAHSEVTESAARLRSEDLRQVAHIERLMDHTILGHRHTKAAVNLACWNLLSNKLTDGAPMSQDNEKAIADANQDWSWKPISARSAIQYPCTDNKHDRQQASFRSKARVWVTQDTTTN